MMTAVIDFIRRIVVSELRGVPDAELLGRFLSSRDEAAFTAVVCKHGPMVYRVCRGVLRNTADAEDAAQATFLVLAQKASSVRKRDSLPSWLHGVAFRTARKLRAAIVRRRARESLAVAPGVAAEDLTVREAGEMLHAELEKLPPRYKGPLVLCYLQGKTHDEAAAELGWTVTAFRGRLERARNKLRDGLARRGVGPSAVPLAGILAEARPALPVTFFVKTARAAVTTAREAVAHGLISSTASHLAQEVIRSMSFTFFKIAGAFVLAVTLAAGGWLALRPAPAAPPPVESKAEAAPKAGAEDSLDKILVSRFKQFARLKADQSGLTLIGDELDGGGFFRGHRIAPDGKSVAIHRETREGMALEIWQFDQPWPGKVVSTGSLIINFFWLPDGKHLVLPSWGVGSKKDPVSSGFKLKLLDVSTLKVADLKMPEGHSAADVSPDGKWFLTAKNVDPKNGKSGAELYRVEYPTGKVERLFDKVTIINPPRWRISPDGKQVAGPQSDDDGKFQVFVGDLSGGPLRQVTREAAGVNNFCGWSPSGKKLLYRVDRQPAKPKGGEAFHQFIVVIDADGRNRKELYDNEGHFNPQGQRKIEDALGSVDWR
jgi:RNA polymerase sigma factor (sigma-70 family)